MAGPNGSGKSTILKEVRNNFYCGPFVNADEIERSLNEKGFVNVAADFSLHVEDEAFDAYLQTFGDSWVKKAKQEKSTIKLHCRESILISPEAPNPYEAAVAADFVRHQLLGKGLSFTFETVMSHPSKVEFLQEALTRGYKNYLYFICTVSPQINLDRVKQRVELGGHLVPPEKIIKRYYESLQLLPQLLPYCYRCYFFDNSSHFRSIEPVAVIDTKRNLEVKTKQLPWWLQEHVIDVLYR